MTVRIDKRKTLLVEEDRVRDEFGIRRSERPVDLFIQKFRPDVFDRPCGAVLFLQPEDLNLFV